MLTSGLLRAEEPAKRPLPDYDGRGGPPETPARKALWIPRILVSPVYFVSEFLVRRPLGATITAAEKAHVPRALYDFFLFGPDHKAGVLPIALIDFGFEPSVGFYAFWDDAGFKGHELRLHGSTWGARWLSGTATERFRFSDHFDLTLTSTTTRRPDYSFCGIGPDSREADLMRYAADSVDSRVVSNLSFAGSSALQTSVGYRGVSFGHSNYDDTNRGLPGYEASVDEALRGREPPGFVSGYRAPFADARLILDTRGRSASESGARVELSAEQALVLLGCASTGRFPLRAPLLRDDDQTPFAKAPEEYYSPFAWDGGNYMVFHPIARFWAVDPAGPATNVNAFDEVPNSSWFENRLGDHPMTPDEVTRGPCSDKVLDPNAPNGSWLIDKGKDNGANPGFRVNIKGLGKFMLKTDPETEPDRATGATAIAARIFCARPRTKTASCAWSPPPGSPANRSALTATKVYATTTPTMSYRTKIGASCAAHACSLPGSTTSTRANKTRWTCSCLSTRTRRLGRASSATTSSTWATASVVSGRSTASHAAWAPRTSSTPGTLPKTS